MSLSPNTVTPRVAVCTHRAAVNLVAHCSSPTHRRSGLHRGSVTIYGRRSTGNRERDQGTTGARICGARMFGRTVWRCSTASKNRRTRSCSVSAATLTGMQAFHTCCRFSCCLSSPLNDPCRMQGCGANILGGPVGVGGGFGGASGDQVRERSGTPCYWLRRRLSHVSTSPSCLQCGAGVQQAVPQQHRRQSRGQRDLLRGGRCE